MKSAVFATALAVTLLAIGSCGGHTVAGAAQLAVGSQPSAPEQSASSGPISETHSPPVTPEATAADSTDPAINFPFDGPPEDTEGVMITWLDSMIADPAYAPVTTDNGQGQWSYSNKATGCLIEYWQIRPANGIASGDRDLSDEMLADLAGNDVQRIHSIAHDDVIPGGVPGDLGSVAVRTIIGVTEANGEASLLSARAFGHAGTHLAVHILCPKGVDVMKARGSFAADGLGIGIIPTN